MTTCEKTPLERARALAGQISGNPALDAKRNSPKQFLLKCANLDYWQCVFQKTWVERNLALLGRPHLLPGR